MTITPYLEELIWAGRAKYKTWTVGTGAAGLNVKNNQTIIITRVDYFGFLDSGEPNIVDDPDIWYSKMNKRITFSSKNRSYNLLARNFYNPLQGLQPSHCGFECYFIFEENVVMNLATFVPVQQWTFGTTSAPVRSGQHQPPLGYGTDAEPLSPKVLTTIDFNSLTDDQVIPFPDTKKSKNVSYNEFITAFQQDTQIQPPSQDLGNIGEQQYPLMTIHYVEINERLTAKFA